MSAKKDQEDAILGGSVAARPAGKVDPPSLADKNISLVLERYNFNHERRGKCVIINNEHFDRRTTNQFDRDGTEVDAAGVESAFLSLGFDVTRYDDLNTLDISINMRTISQEDFSDCDCFALVILSHGEEGYVYGTNGRVTIDSIVKNFKGDLCPSLAGKPKLFFIQACRGKKYDWGVEVADAVAEDETDASPEPQNIRKIPIEADVLYAYSVVPGYFSWRNNVDGSWFMQSLCRVIREHGDAMEILPMMQLVCKLVAYEFASCTDDDFTTGMMQVPCIVSTLTKQVFFKPKY